MQINKHTHSKWKVTGNLPTPDNPNLLEYLSNTLQTLRDTGTTNTNTRTNPKEEKALRSLQKLPNTVIKPADKGGALVLWPSKSYLEEVQRQLNNP